ncbi:MAG TPA: hypothetical protein VF650_14940 [Allosphingosinicella sp.]|jgi:hypothetical protein
MDQDGLSTAIGLLALLILASGLRGGEFHIQFLSAARTANPVGYWIFAAVLALVALESLRRAFFIGCADC